MNPGYSPYSQNYQTMSPAISQMGYNARNLASTFFSGLKSAVQHPAFQSGARSAASSAWGLAKGVGQQLRSQGSDPMMQQHLSNMRTSLVSLTNPQLSREQMTQSLQTLGNSATGAFNTIRSGITMTPEMQMHAGNLYGALNGMANRIGNVANNTLSRYYSANNSGAPVSGMISAGGQRRRKRKTYSAKRTGGKRHTRRRR